MNRQLKGTIWYTAVESNGLLSPYLPVLDHAAGDDMDELRTTDKGEQAALDGIEPPAVLARARALVVPALRAAVDRLQGEQMRRIAGYHLGWVDADGQPLPGDGVGGKAIRPTLAVLSAQAGGGTARPRGWSSARGNPSWRATPC